MDLKIRRLAAGSFSLGMLAPLFAILLTSTAPVVVADSSDCSVAPDVGMDDKYANIEDVDDGGWWGWNSGLEELSPMRSDLYIEIELGENEGKALRMELVPGYSYTFCVEFHSDQENPPTSGAKGDVYLLSKSNWDLYAQQYDAVQGGWAMDDEALNWIPVEWRDMTTFIPFRDTHAYENKRSTSFSTALDNDNKGWVSWFGEPGDAQYFLVLDAWNNSRPNDAVKLDGDMIVQVWVDVEDRLTLPKFTAYIIVGLLPISCIVVPLILHSRYHSSGADGKGEETQIVPLLEQ